MNIQFSLHAWEDYQYWLQVDKNITKKINSLIKDIIAHPFDGIGKPEPLKYDLAGFWSRRIDLEHRLVYKFVEGVLVIYSCRFHYET